MPVAKFIVGCLAGCLWAASTAADVSVRLSVEVPQGAKGSPAPQIVAAVENGPVGLAADTFSLTQEGTNVSAKALSLRRYAEGTERLALVLLIEGHEYWIGNESYVESEDDKAPGAFAKLGAALESLAGVGPAGSQFAMIVYGKGASVRVPFSPLSELGADKLGSQKDFEGTTMRDLATGASEAVALLRGVTAARKALLVIGDGCDTNADEAKSQLVAMRKTFEQDKVELYSIVYRAERIECEVPVIKSLVTDARSTESVDGIPAKLNEIAARIGNRIYLTFPGFDEKRKLGFSWDGKEHEFVLKNGESPLGNPALLSLSPTWRPPRGFRWWYIGAPLGVLFGLGLLGAFLSRKKPAPLPEPIASGPQKTVMLNAGGQADGYPVVGWLVAVNGPHANQTYKLQPGITKIGTGSSCQIVLHDTFLSTEHCQIAGSPTGFQLQDGGSTNGTFVNDKRIQRHDLLDNDVVTLGKLHLVFKTIN